MKLPIYSINKICCPRILMKLQYNIYYILTISFFVSEIFCPPLTVSASTIMNLSTGVSKTNSMDISVNTSATFSCKPGFRLNDSSPLLCQIDGTWNGTLPNCSGTPKWTYSVYNLHHGRGNNVLYTDTVLQNEENLENGMV